jgi:hypothetical protein
MVAPLHLARMCVSAALVKPRGVIADSGQQPYISGMDEKDVLEHPGPPDKTIGRGERMRSRVWMCSSCKLTITSIEPIPVPAPCLLCGGIAFETVEQRLQ